MRLLVGALSCALAVAGLSSCAPLAPGPAMPQPSIAFPPLDDSAGKRAPILRSPIASYDVSLDEVERPTPTTLALWVRTRYTGNNSMLAVGFGGAVARDEFDCAGRRVRIRASTVYDRDSATVKPRPMYTRRGSGHDGEVTTRHCFPRSVHSLGRKLRQMCRVRAGSVWVDGTCYAEDPRAATHWTSAADRASVKP